ncbi:MAG: hypothetical protein JWM39_355 [Parcubacteria group bacterium]|nr:hypothetical protein [Parcubacteria group bacterium]
MKFLTAFLVALIGSVVVNVIIVSVLGPMVTNPAMPLMALTIMPVAMFTAIGAIGATIVYAIMRATMMRPNKAFIWLSVVVFIVSCYPDYMVIGAVTGPFAGGTLADALVLMLMHLAAAIIIVWALVKLWGSRTVLTKIPGMPTMPVNPQA